VFAAGTGAQAAIAGQPLLAAITGLTGAHPSLDMRRIVGVVTSPLKVSGCAWGYLDEQMREWVKGERSKNSSDRLRDNV
jgi:hypothetical protein